MKKTACLTLLCLISIFKILSSLAPDDQLHAIKHIHIVGERCSGTNFVGQLVLTNVAGVSVSNPANGDPIGWKHGYVLDDILTKNKKCLFIHVYRNPYDWIRSFHAQPWHAHPALTNLSFSDFIRKEWQSKHDSPEIEMIHERNLESGNFFRNVIELRTSKLKHFEGLRNRTTYFCSVPYEIVNDDPLKFLNDLALHFSLKLRPRYRPVITYKGKNNSQKKYQKKQYLPLKLQDLEFINQALDWKFENRLGYEINQEDTCSRIPCN